LQSRWLRLAVEVPIAGARGLDLYHGVWALPPLIGCRTVVTVHDLTFCLHPEWFRRGHAAILQRAVGGAVRKADRVIAISERTACDIAEWYGIPRSRITVTHLAPRPEVMAGAGIARLPAEPYFLHVGNLVGRKNVQVVIRALALLRGRGVEVPLVLAGQPGDACEAVRALARRLGLGRLVRFSGYLDDRDLGALYASCTALVHPSLYEGFGLTAVEAMALGRPVLAADAGALPEIVGDGGRLLPPAEPNAWADAMERVLNAPDWLPTERALRRAREFSWERCARETVEVYRSVL
jgi:alpha-1,3-rhamnosyl/mannosyltransferase